MITSINNEINIIEFKDAIKLVYPYPMTTNDKSGFWINNKSVRAVILALQEIVNRDPKKYIL